tara:strand:- start:16707 stop:18101 length:1395 start_codon:yes stop_codon:yes gene_type:complete
MIAMIVISLLITGVSTIYFFKNQNNEYHLARLKRKEQAVMLALKYFVIEHNIERVNETLDKKLDELANIHSLDFNLYNEYGRLFYSTIEDETKEFLAKETIPATIVDSVITTNEPIILEEKMDDQNYLSTYFILRNQSTSPIAVVNIPYHKDGERSRNELSSFLSTLIQVFLFLFVGASLVAYFLSNYITKSLQSVSEGIKQTKLTNENPHIEWSGDDEIGELVSAYNRMVDELHESADMLAKSERQSAWKEMARQVAHEIKNPLTPMRLNIQHLQRSITDNPEDIQERIDKFTKVMIEQIDTLSRIASEFSNFAKMPRPVMERLNVVDSLTSAVDLYAHTPNVEVIFTNKMGNVVEIEADKKQIIRAMSNLIKNGIQSIPSHKKGKIEVVLFEAKEHVQIAVTDNGKGIPSIEKEKIFEPYFTTKSGGTGLGLAMVKNIFNEFGASISFQTEEDKGTTFLIVF